jgi:hypothetical protein
VTPHIAIDGNVRKSGKPRATAIDQRTTRHAGYRISQVIRKRVEEIFGWSKSVGGLVQGRPRGLARVEARFILARRLRSHPPPQTAGDFALMIEPKIPPLARARRAPSATSTPIAAPAPASSSARTCSGDEAPTPSRSRRLFFSSLLAHFPGGLGGVRLVLRGAPAHHVEKEDRALDRVGQVLRSCGRARNPRGFTLGNRAPLFRSGSAGETVGARCAGAKARGQAHSGLRPVPLNLPLKETTECCD